MKSFPSLFLAFLMALPLAALLFLFIPVVSWIATLDRIELEKKNLAVVSSVLQKKPPVPPPRRRSVSENRQKRPEPLRSLSRQKVSMDLGAGGGAGVAMAGGGMEQLAYAEGEADQDPVLRVSIPPTYPDLALARGVSGKVIAILLVDEAGLVEAVEFVQVPGSPGDLGFEGSVSAAVKKWRFLPASVDGIAVRSRFRQEFEF